ncbi:hypothetical protein BVG16_26135 [Paenibacillus selenitireducens]|uniref:DUF418 domain-containing protein n=1 Tax=Paenibacillus selenitireducens TaxID=1324314 RepID=A0A1T2X2W6_9BACL|nr:DUF418 domain-containing protein [Paenibacillus selenitireducens]OPA73923.1 hypothetical protein BVG16_26135 [Paenibacillus selenitireducens]
MPSQITNQRIDTLDYLRGFALMGIVLVNILALLQVPEAEAGTANRTMEMFLQLFVEARFFAIFSFLFGVGFYIFISRAKVKGVNSLFLFIRRLVALLVVGYFHKQFQPGEALFLYAIVGFILIPFYRLKSRTNVILACILMVPLCVIAGKAGMILPMFLLGLAMGQYGVFEQIDVWMSKIKRVQWTACVLGIVGLAGQYLLMGDTMMLAIDDTTPESVVRQLTYYSLLEVYVGAILSVCYVTTLMRLLQIKFVQRILCPLKYYGRMALTNYIGQTVIILGLGHVLNLFGRVTPIQTTLLCIGIYAVQMLFSWMWLRYFRMGPLEWIWRICTYLQVSFVQVQK